MAEFTKANIRTIRSMDLESIPGPMAGGTAATGAEVNSMD
jgi:hypothetical protein